MTLPGFNWLKRQLSGVDEVAGGYQTKMGDPMTSGAGCAMSLIFIIVWLVALVPLSLWALGRFLFRKARSRA